MSDCTADVLMAQMTLEERVGQLVIARYVDHEAVAPYARRGLISGMTPQLRDRDPAEAAEFLNRFQGLSKYPLLFGWSGICYRGGTDLRLQELMRLGATRSPELAYLAGRVAAEECRAVGFHFGGAPVLDVNTNPDNPIINLRAFGDDPALVAEMGIALCRGMVEGGALPVCMHFPGHGATGCDSHIRMPVVERTLEELEQVDLAPFRAAVAQGAARVVCTNHCHYPALEPEREVPATLSRPIVTGLLREQIGYDGLIISDSLTMRAIKEPYGIEEAAVETVRAGHDLILQDYQSDPGITLDALVGAVRGGRIPAGQLEASVRRVLRAKESLGLFRNRIVDPAQVGRCLAAPESRAVARRIARESVTLLENRGLPLRAGGSERWLLVTNGGPGGIQEDRQVENLPGNEHLFQGLRARVTHVEHVPLGSGAEREPIGRALAAAGTADRVLFGLFTEVRAYAEEGIRLPAGYRDLIRAVVAAGKPVCVLNFGNPWALDDLPRPAVSLCAFSDAPDSLDAALAVLFGDIPSRGRLPVRLKEYRFGCGL